MNGIDLVLAAVLVWACLIYPDEVIDAVQRAIAWLDAHYPDTERRRW